MLEWMAEYLPSPSDSTEPFILTDEQAKLVLAWYGLDDHGTFVNRRAILEMVKGWGKSPLLAGISLAELGASSDLDAAPVLFDGWDASGDPIGRPWGTGDAPPAWVQIAAVSEDQTDNTYGALYEMLVANDHKAAMRLGIDDGRTRLYVHGRPSKLEPVTAAAGSREGQRVTFSVLDETHLWTRQNGGVKLADTLRRNAAKMGGRTVETTNAPQLGIKSVAEKSGSDVERGFSGILHYAIRPPKQPDPDWSDDELLEALATCYGDAHWVDLDRILNEIRDPSTAWDDSLRFYFNIRAAGTGRAVDPRRWDELGRQDGPPPPKTEIGLGFDGSISQDETWLVGCTREGYAFRIGRWFRPPGDVNFTVPRTEVMAKVEWAFDYYTVLRFNFDPPKWWTEGEAWQAKWNTKDNVRVEPLDTNQPRRFAPAVDRFLVAVREGTIHHDSDSDLADHVKASHLKKVHVNSPEDDGRTKYVVVKGEDRRKIDGAIALILAHEAAMTMPEAPIPTRTRLITPDDD